MSDSATTDAEYLDGYRADRYPRPALTVDVVVLTLLQDKLHVLLVQRGVRPFLGVLALPGGFLHIGGADADVSLDAAAARELEEETGLRADDVEIRQLRAFGRPGRDPRMRVITVAYTALLRPEVAQQVRAGTDANAVRWEPVASIVAAADTRSDETRSDETRADEKTPAPVTLAFDHREILLVALETLRSQLDREPIAFALCPATFTSRELQSVYEAVTAEAIDDGNFQRRLQKMERSGVIARAEGRRLTSSRPAKVFRFVTD